MNDALSREIKELIDYIEDGELGESNPELKTSQAVLIVLNRVLEQDNEELLSHFAEHLTEFITLWCDSEPMHDERTHKLDNLMEGIDLGEFED